LTGPRTTEQSSLVMAALVNDGDAQRENERDERDAQVGRQAGGDGAVPSQAGIRCECAFTYMNAVSGKTLTGGFSPMESTGARPTTSDALSAVFWTKRGSAGRR